MRNLVVDAVEEIDVAVARLLGRELSIESFISQVTNSAWEEAFAGDQDLLNSLWRIENLAYHIQNYPEQLVDTEIARQMRDAVEEIEARSR